jgi:FtsZ-binding cell division protein ZapB
MAKTASQSVNLAPIDRLEEKIRLLVSTVDRLKMEHTRAADENAHLRQELDAARARLADAESSTAEMSSLKEERDLIRDRVSDMLQQLEALNL